MLISNVTDDHLNVCRNAFDEDRVPALYEDEAILQDIHSVASLLKMYFRELPNPLCTYQLYHTFVSAVQSSQEEGFRLLRMRDAVQKLPPPHYRYFRKGFTYRWAHVILITASRNICHDKQAAHILVVLLPVSF